jgi:hypothetical protein
MMKYLLIILLLVQSLVWGASEGKIVRLKKINSPIIIDGIIDDAWSLADSNFINFQLSPFYAKAPTHKAYAKVLTTDNTLYCLIVCYDERENIQKNPGKLDDGGGDAVSIMLDTFGDRRSAYKFVVNAAGARADCRLLDDARNRDYSWDGIWFSSAKIYDWGYVVEMEIPYKSIQYDEKLKEWGLDFDRWRPVNSEDLYWCEYEQHEGQRISKFGKLVFDGFTPSIKGMNLEFYPVAFGKINYLGNNKYEVDPKAGIDIFYNPSQQLTFQATANPDFAQIEADPFTFNISRYETFYNERRPFFIQGQEIFTPSGAQSNSGFYSPMNLLYTRRVGKKLADGSEVPITFGAKASGRIKDWEYGGFVARTSQVDYMNNDVSASEPTAVFISGRVKKQILDNSSLGVMFVGKHSPGNTNGVIDVDGAFRTSDWQLSYQFAKSINNSDGGYAGSLGFVNFGKLWTNMIRARFVDSDFNIDQVGYVPWKGTKQLTALTGPAWYFKDNYITNILIFTGPYLNYEKVDEYTDWAYVFGFDFNFINNMGFEIEIDLGKSKDESVKYDYSQYRFSYWINQAKWNANAWGKYQRTFNFSRNYEAGYANFGTDLSWNVFPILNVGTSFDFWLEQNPSGDVEEITYNARPYFSVTPINDLNIMTYVDNTWRKNGVGMDRVFLGFLFAYQFSPKSWVYLALNETHDRDNNTNTMHMSERVSVFKIKYLYYL